MTRAISMIIYDFDGVLTDNKVYFSQDGQEMVVCHRGDGWWIGEIGKLGINQLILSTETNPVVSARGNKLGIEVWQGEKDKGKALERIVQEKKMTLSQILYVGNDMNDFECFRRAGWTCAPKDSHPKILELARTVLPVAGGQGVVRYIFDLCLELNFEKNSGYR